MHPLPRRPWAPRLSTAILAAVLTAGCGGGGDTDAGSTPTGAGSTPTGAGSTPTGGGSTPTGAGSTPTGAGSTPTGAGSTPAGIYRGTGRAGDQPRPDIEYQIECVGGNNSQCTLYNSRNGVKLTVDPRPLQQQGPGQYTYNAPASAACGLKDGTATLNGETLTFEEPTLTLPAGAPCNSYTFSGTRIR